MPQPQPPKEYLLGRSAQACLAAEDRRQPPLAELPPEERRKIRQKREEYYRDFVPRQALTELAELAAQTRRCRAGYVDAGNRIPGLLQAGQPFVQGMNKLGQAARLLEEAAGILEPLLPQLPYAGQRPSIQKYNEPRRIATPPPPPSNNPAAAAPRSNPAETAADEPETDPEE